MKKTRKRPPPAPALKQSFARRHGWRLAALWALVLVAYSNSFHGMLLFDNQPVILGDPRVHAATLSNIGSILTEGYWHINPASGLYRPLTTLSYLVNYAILGNGPNPAGYHGLNLLLHAGNVALVYALGLLIFGDFSQAWLLAALWGVHPLLTESVTNIVGRADLLAAFGVLGGLWCYAQSARHQGRRKWEWLAAMAIAQAIGLFSKENAAVLPGILLLYDLAWPERSTWRERAPAYAVLALPFAAFFAIRAALHTHMAIIWSENPLVGADFWTARLTAVKVIGKFLWLFVWPDGLSADYTYNAVPLFGWRLANWEDAQALIALAVCLGAILLVIRWRRAQPALFFFLLFFFVALAPTANVIVLIGSIMAERFVYLPTAGLAGCVVVAIHALGRRLSLRRAALPRAEWIAASLLCFAFAVRTHARNLDWLDERSLWTSAVRVCPEGARCHMSLGHAWEQIPGHLADVIAEYRIALRIEPNYVQAHYNLGAALAQLPGHWPDAISEFKAALRIEPNYADAHYNLGSALAQLPGHLPEAIAEWDTTLRIEPNHASAHNNLGNALEELPGRLPEATAHYREATRIAPDFAEAHYNLARALSQTPGGQSEAILEYQAAVRADPNLAQAHNNLGNALAQIPGRLTEAIGEWQAAVRIDPNLAQAHYNLGTALSQIPGRMNEAVAELETALRIQPNPETRKMLDRLRAEQR